MLVSYRASERLSYLEDFLGRPHRRAEKSIVSARMTSARQQPTFWRLDRFSRLDAAISAEQARFCSVGYAARRVSHGR